MKTMTLRNVPDDLVKELEKEKARRGDSLNKLAIELMREALGLSDGRKSNGLAALAGNWSEEELKQFQRDTAHFEQIDKELWR